jgi:Zn-dependent protease with chaperone function
MDFFAAQDRARGQTKWLVLAFVAALVSLIAAFYGVAWLVEVLLMDYAGDGRPAPPIPLWSAPRLLLVGAGVLLVVGTASFLKVNEFRGGGASVAASLGGRRVDMTTQAPLERRLVNVVEEMAIAAGVSVPAIFILDEEQGINAFAAGYAPEDAAVAVSRGCLETLSRDELQGVIAHEFSHILNGDMRINLRMAGIIFGLFVLVVVGRGILYAMRFSGGAGRSRSSGSGKGGGGGIILAIIVVALAFFLLGLIGQLFGRFIQAAVSRQREYLADASAVQFTRNPAGIRDALRRIGGHVEGSRVQHRQSETLAHCFFANALKSSFGGGFRTHPPLPKRISALDPQWDGSFLDQPAATSSAAFVPESAPTVGKKAASGKEALFTAGAVAVLAGGAGAPQTAHLRYAQDLRRRLLAINPAGISDPREAEALVLGLFIDRAGGRPVPWEDIEGTLGHPVRVRVERWQRDLLDALPRTDRLPVFELALAPLGQLDQAARKRTESAIATLVALDGKVSLHEFILGALLQNRLGGAERRGQTRHVAFGHPRAIRPQLQRVLSLVALESCGGEAGAAETALAGILQKHDGWEEFQFSGARPDFAQLEDDFRFLRNANNALKREILTIVRELVLRDEEVTASEADLYRLLAVILGVPFAPLVTEEDAD